MKKITIILLILISWLQYSLWLGKNGMHDLICIKNNVIAQQSYNAQLKARNKQLIQEINDLNESWEAIEERSRNELCMIKLGEVFYRLIPKHKNINRLHLQNKMLNNDNETKTKP